MKRHEKGGGDPMIEWKAVHKDSNGTPIQLASADGKYILDKIDGGGRAQLRWRVILKKANGRTDEVKPSSRDAARGTFGSVARSLPAAKRTAEADYQRQKALEDAGSPPRPKTPSLVAYREAAVRYDQAEKDKANEEEKEAAAEALTAAREKALADYDGSDAKLATAWEWEWPDPPITYRVVKSWPVSDSGPLKGKYAKYARVAAAQRQKAKEKQKRTPAKRRKPQLNSSPRGAVPSIKIISR